MHSVYFDGGSRGSTKKSGCGAVLYDAEGREVDALSRSLPTCTNNVAEYNGLILGLEMVIARGIKRVRVYGDSKLVVCQVRGEWKINFSHLQELKRKVDELIQTLDHFDIQHVLRAKNARADQLANEAMDSV